MFRVKGLHSDSKHNHGTDQGRTLPYSGIFKLNVYVKGIIDV